MKKQDGGQGRKLQVAQEVNPIFERMKRIIEDGLAQGKESFDVLEIAGEAGLELTLDDLVQLHVPPTVIAHSFLPWNEWWPWRDLWIAHMRKQFPDVASFVPGGAGKARLADSLLSRGLVAISDPMP